MCAHTHVNKTEYGSGQPGISTPRDRDQVQCPESPRKAGEPLAGSTGMAHPTHVKQRRWPKKDGVRWRLLETISQEGLASRVGRGPDFRKELRAGKCTVGLRVGQGSGGGSTIWQTGKTAAENAEKENHWTLMPRPRAGLLAPPAGQVSAGQAALPPGLIHKAFSPRPRVSQEGPGGGVKATHPTPQCLSSTSSCAPDSSFLPLQTPGGSSGGSNDWVPDIQVPGSWLRILA